MFIDAPTQTADDILVQRGTAAMTTIITSKTTFTPEDLLNLSDAVDYELVDGRLVERRLGNESSVVAGAILTILNVFVRGKRKGFVAGADAGYQCFPGAPDKVRKPDVSYVRAGRMPGDLPPKGFARIAPDLAVEVLAPNDLASEIEEKVSEYLSAGVKLVWVVNPQLKTVRIHRPNGAITGLTATDRISGEDVIEGFECEVAEFFRL
jgi:Uma2 family endonuclease